MKLAYNSVQIIITKKAIFKNNFFINKRNGMVYYIIYLYLEKNFNWLVFS